MANQTYKDAVKETVVYAKGAMLEQLGEFDEAMTHNAKVRAADRALGAALDELQTEVNKILCAKMDAGAKAASFSLEESKALFPDLHEKIDLLSKKLRAIEAE